MREVIDALMQVATHMYWETNESTEAERLWRELRDACDRYLGASDE